MTIMLLLCYQCYYYVNHLIIIPLQPSYTPAIMSRWPNVSLPLGQRRRLWANS